MLPASCALERFLHASNLVYIYIYILGVDCWIERVKRWSVSCGVDRESRVGERVQPIVGRTRNPCVLLYLLRFVSRFGKLGQHNNARMAWT